jgi:hypothetical protein
MGESRESVVERLRAFTGPEKFNCFLPIYIDDIRALLTVVEAAQEYRNARSDPSASAVYRAGKGQALWDSLAALTSEQKP